MGSSRVARRALLVMVVVAAAGRGVASEPFQQHFELAVNHFLSERYDASLHEFEAAYSARQLPRLLVNIGTAHLKQGHGKEALESYERFLRLEPNPDPAVRRKVDGYLAQARQLVAPASAVAVATAAAPAPAPGPAARGAARRRPSPHAASTSAVTPTLASSALARIDAGVAARLRAVSGSGPDDVWVVGDEGTVLRFDGRAWTRPYRPRGSYLRYVWGRSATDVWAVGMGGLVLRFDGSEWHDVPRPSDADLIGVWATGPADVWVMDATAAIYRFEGTDWQELIFDRPDGLDLHGFFFAGPQVVWAVGYNGAVVRWDGQALRRHVSGSLNDLRSVWGSGPQDVWAAGNGGVAVHFDGRSWKAAATPTKGDLKGVSGSRPGDVWAVGGFDGGVILHWDGKAWSESVAATPNRVNGVVTFGDHAIAVGARAVYRFDGTTWQEEPRRTCAPLHAVWGSAENDVWAVGDAGAILPHPAPSPLSARPERTRGRRPSTGLTGAGPEDDGPSAARPSDLGSLFDWPVRPNELRRAFCCAAASGRYAGDSCDSVVIDLSGADEQIEPMHLALRLATALATTALVYVAFPVRVARA